MNRDSVASGMKSKKVEYATIAVKYRFIDGYHVFTSEDVKGLHVASKDAKKAFDSVSEVLEELIWRKTKQRGVVEPAMPFEQWLKRRVAPRTATPQQLGTRNFVLRITAEAA